MLTFLMGSISKLMYGHIFKVKFSDDRKTHVGQKHLRKAFCIILSASLLFGCQSSKTALSPQAKEWGYFSYPGTDWGITEEDLFSALKKTEADFSIQSEADAETGTTATAYTITLPYMGNDCETSFVFRTVPMSDYSTLQTVTITYPVQSEEDFIQLCGSLESWIGQEAIAANEPSEAKRKYPKEGGMILSEQDPEYDSMEHYIYEHTYQIGSVATMADLPQDIKDGYNRYNQKLILDGSLPYPVPAGTEVEDLDFTQSIKEPLSSL